MDGVGMEETSDFKQVIVSANCWRSIESCYSWVQILFKKRRKYQSGLTPERILTSVAYISASCKSRHLDV